MCELNSSISCILCILFLSELVNDTDSSSSCCLLWIPSHCSIIRVTLPVGGSSTGAPVDVSLDSLVPLLSRLALHSQRRQTRLRAAELLHACVRIFVGHTVPQYTEQVSVSALSKYLLLVAIRPLVIILIKDYQVLLEFYKRF